MLPLVSGALRTWHPTRLACRRSNPTVRPARVLTLLFACLTGLGVLPTQAQTIDVEVAFPALTFSQPVDVQNAGDGTNRLFVVQMGGIVRVFENDPAATSAGVFLDISARVLFNDRFGLLGLAFHPDFASNGAFFVNYNAPNPSRSVISRFQVSAANPDVADPGSEEVLLEIEQPHRFHNGGALAFGPDGYLYIGLGDGGPVGGTPDPNNNGQRLDTLLGAMLRIDVDGTQANLPYAIPADNPWVGNTEGYREEIWAWGFRNPWRYSFDSVTGRLWAADNGEDRWEEIDIVDAGNNYGWKVMEATSCYDPPTGCDTSNLTLPVWRYGGTGTRRSVIGGHVYRGSRNPELQGRYVYTDWLLGTIWALDYDGTNATNATLHNGLTGVTSIGVDEAGELLFCQQTSGQLYRFHATVTPVRKRSWSNLKSGYRD